MPTCAVPAPEATLHCLEAGFQWRHESMETEVSGGVSADVLAGNEWSANAQGARCELSITNSGTAAVSISAIRLKFRLISEASLDKIFFQSWAMSGETGLREAGDQCRSSGVMGWSNTQGTAAAVAGFLDHSLANTQVEAARINEHTWQVTAIVLCEGKPLAPGDMLALPPFWLRTGAGLFALLEEYAEEVAAIMGTRKTKAPESGWCSWYHFYGKETFAEVISCAEELVRSPLAGSLRTIQIDDGWNRASADESPDAWGDWEAHPDKFPSGMADAARRIHELGFRAGLWLAPFAVSARSRLFVEHPEWLVQRWDSETAKLQPAPTADNPNVFQLDCTHPEALRWLKETFRRVFRDWDFDYIKIDFLQIGAREGIRHDPAATSIEAYRKGMQCITETAGDDKFILGCGAPLLASVGLVDGMRVGPDVGGRWAFDLGWPEWPVGNCSIRAAAIPSVWSQWMQGKWWQNDPDCLVLRATSGLLEQAFFKRVEKDVQTSICLATPLGLASEEAGLWARLVWITGGMALLSEVWSELPGERQDMLVKCFEPHGSKASVLDWFEIPDAAALATCGTPGFVGVFNFGNRPCLPELSAKKLGLSERWTLRERWSGETLQGEGAVVVFPELPPHAGRVWESVCC